MHIRHVSSSRTARRVLASAGIVGLALGAAACGSDDSGSGGSGSAPRRRSASPSSPRTRPTRSSSPCRRAPRPTPPSSNVDLTVASGKQEGDDQGQITAIEDAIARGDKGILITPMSTGVNAAIKKARDAGLYVIALDTPPDPANTVDITFATNNREAGQLDRQVGRSPPSTARRPPSPCSTCSTTRSSPSTTTATRASSRAWASTSADPKKNGDEAKTGKYTGGKGGDYTIVCNEAEQRRRGRRPHGHGELPVQEPEHQRRLHDQRADRGRRQRRAQGGRHHRRDRSSRSTAAAPASSRSRTASSVPPPSSTR